MNVTANRVDSAKIKTRYNVFAARKTWFIAVGLVLLCVLAISAISMGAASSLGVGDVIRSIIGRIFPFAGVESSDLADIIVWDYRMPRILAAIVAGMGFAISGASMQGVMRNPLVSPFTIGISSAAAFGAALALVSGIGIGSSGTYIVVANAFLLSLLAAFLVYGLARVRGITPETLILAGIAIMYLFSSSTSLMQYIATEDQLAGVVYWMFGSLAKVGWHELAIMSVGIGICIPLLVKYSWDLNAMAAGDETAASLGTNTRRARIVCICLATLATSVVICFTGIIGFVCLVAPHITRMIIGNDHRYLLPCSCLVGAFLLLGADTVGRMAIAPSEIPVGIVTSFIGVPMFIYLLITRRRQYWQ